jgi:Uma2 family endonuclease
MSTHVSTNTPAGFVSEEEYLSTSYEPGVEYVHGRLEEPVMVQSVHGLLQGWICAWFFNRRKEWKVVAGVEIHTKVESGIYRLPDVVVGPMGPWDPILKKPPLIVIEIMSPNDREQKLLEKAREYSAMGIPNIWLIDPETRMVQVWRNDAFAIVTEPKVRVAGGPVYLDLQEMFAYLDEIQGLQG